MKFRFWLLPFNKMNKYYCINCSTEISYNSFKYGSKLCRSCSCKQRYQNPRNNPNYRYGHNINSKKCLDCEKLIHCQANRCRKCNSGVNFDRLHWQNYFASIIGE
jgi:hypothetical protein